MKKLVLTLTFIALIFAINAQEITQNIRGKIVDTHSQFPIIGANIELIGSNPYIGGRCDIYGDFEILDAPVGRVSLSVTSIGYKPVVLNNLVLTSAKELIVNISMEEDITNLQEAVIVAKKDKKKPLNKMATVSARTISVEEAGKFAGSLNDPARMAQNYAGVSGSSDDRNDIIIRGNSPFGVLWRMEGIDIPSPNHFSTLGTTGGPVSMLNLNNLSNSDFMTSAWSADYGNALSGVFDLKLRNGNNQNLEYLAQIGFNGFELGAEGPFKKGGQGSYLVNYRYSTLAVFDLLGINLGLGTAVPQYQDITFKLNFPTKKNGQFSLWGIGGFSFIEFEPIEEADSTNLFAADNQASNFDSNTGILGGSYKYFFNDKTFTELILAASYSNNFGRIDSLKEDDSLINTYGSDQTQIKYAANLKLNRKINSKNTFSIGVIAEQYFMELTDSVLVDIDSLGLNPTHRLISDNSGDGILLQSYINYQHRFNEKLTLNAGVHSQHFLLSEANTIEPRLGMKYAVNNRNTLSIGAGIHSQMQPITLYFVEDYNTNGDVFLPNNKLDFNKAFHSVIGHDFSINEFMRLKTEIYYQYLYNIPIEKAASSFSMLNEGAGFTIPNGTGYENEGTGENIGAEITLERFFNKGFYFLTTVSVFDSKYKGSDNIERNTAFNSNCVINGLVGKEFELKKNKSFGIDSKVTYTGGKRYTPIDLEASRIAQQEVLVENQEYTQQHDPYFKIDLKFTYKSNGEKLSQEFSVDLQNLTGQQNIFQSGYNVRTEDIGFVYQRGFFPNVNYKILF